MAQNSTTDLSNLSLMQLRRLSQYYMWTSFGAKKQANSDNLRKLERIANVALKSFKQAPEAWEIMTDYYLEIDNKKEALRCAKKALALYGSSWKANGYRKISLIYSHFKEDKKAEEWMLKSILEP